MAKRKLLSSDDEDCSAVQTTKKGITINKDYAVKYEEKKKKQELSALQEKYKGHHDNNSSISESDSESDEEEDEDGELLTKEVDAKILTTLATIKARAPEIYEGVKFFDEDLTLETVHKDGQKSGGEKQKKVTLKEYQTRRVLDGKESDDEGNNDDDDDSVPKSYASEQEAIKDELKRAFYQNTATNQEDDGDLVMTKKEKTKEELEREETEYREFLLQNLKSNPNAQQAMQDWIAYSNATANGTSETADMNMSADDKFLIDYIMNRGWMERNGNNDKKYTLLHVDSIIEQVEASEEEVEKAEAFEEQYNFRYEHQDGSNIISHPRHIEDSMRRQDSKRQRERESAKLRKQQEKARQQEEIKRLKNLKREELMRKAERLIKVSGTKKAEKLLNANGDHVDDSSGSDFDPQEHDKKMAAIFNDDYYNEDDALDVSDHQSDVEVSKPVKKLLKRATKKDDKEDKTDAGKAIPDAVKKAIEEQLYKLDYEDKIDDIKCRFKYKSVPSSTYGLDYADIFTASDKALNRHVSLKKLAPYRPEEQQRSDMRKYGDKRRVWMFRNAASDGVAVSENGDSKWELKKRKLDH